MSRRYVPALACSLALVAGFTHAVLTAPAPGELRPAVECFEDGSCTNGWCDPLQQCHEHKEPNQ